MNQQVLRSPSRYDRGETLVDEMVVTPGKLPLWRRAEDLATNVNLSPTLREFARDVMALALEGSDTVVLKDAELDGKKIGYSSVTEFLVQVGKGPKGAYKTRYRVVGNLGQAVLYYKGINIGNGYKKRLLMPSCSKNPVLAKAAS